jgi:ribosomal protein L13E
MPTYFLVELIQKTVAQNLNAQKKQFAAERAVALAELQAKGIAYKDACKLLGITMTESAQENAPAAIATK